jgi:serine/threonine-protein kinase RsbW
MPGDGAALLMHPPAFRCCIAGDADSVRRGLAAALAAPPLAALGPDDRGTVEIVLAEVLNNIVEHAYAGRPGSIRLAVRTTADGIAIAVEDDGRAMPGGALPAGAAPDPAALPEGGFGWHLIRSLCSRIDYRSAGGRNRLRLRLAVFPER